MQRLATHSPSHTPFYSPSISNSPQMKDKESPLINKFNNVFESPKSNENQNIDDNPFNSPPQIQFQ